MALVQTQLIFPRPFKSCFFAHLYLSDILCLWKVRTLKKFQGRGCKIPDNVHRTVFLPYAVVNGETILRGLDLMWILFEGFICLDVIAYLNVYRDIDWAEELELDPLTLGDDQVEKALQVGQIPSVIGWVRLSQGTVSSNSKVWWTPFFL